MEIFHSSWEKAVWILKTLFSLKTCVTEGKCVPLGMSKMCHFRYVYCICSAWAFMKPIPTFLQKLVFRFHKSFLPFLIAFRKSDFLQSMEIQILNNLPIRFSIDVTTNYIENNKENYLSYWFICCYVFHFSTKFDNSSFRQIYKDLKSSTKIG